MTEDVIEISSDSSRKKTSHWFIRLPALAAGVVAGYLLYLSLANHGLPAGCGEGSGCEEVLTSRWSQVFGIPVSGPAVLIYLTIISTTFFIGPHTKPDCAWKAQSLLLLLAATVIIAAVWFIGLQLIVVGSICSWCMADHTLGLLTAAAIFWKVPIRTGSVSTGDSAPASAIPFGHILRLGGMAFLLVGGLIVSQAFGPYEGPQLQRLPPGENADTGPGVDRMISILDGKLQFSPHKAPMLGSPDAPKLLVLLFDYCCPHCRATHGYLRNGMQRYEDQLGVVLMPMPLNSECNPFWEHTESRFENSCELAKLALAVWKADPLSFHSFDVWLFESEMPRNPAEARKKAEELVSREGLQNALADQWIEDWIRQDVTAYHDSQAERIPVIISPGFTTIVGRTESQEQLFTLLEKELGIQPVNESTFSNDKLKKIK